MPIVIGTATLLEEREFRKEYETAAWYKRVRVAAGTASPIYAELARNQNPDHPDGVAVGAIVGVTRLWWSLGEGVVTASLFTTSFGGNIHSVARDQYVGEREHAGEIHPSPHELGQMLAAHPGNPVYGLWRIALDPAYEVIAKPVYRWVEDHYVRQTGLVTFTICPRDPTDSVATR